MRFQHGDVILVKIEEISPGATKIKVEDGFVLERGEGVHTHFFPSVKGMDVFETTKKQIEMLVAIPTKIDHEEHGVKTLYPGIYRKEIENEYDAETDEAYKTKD
jgi:hypothetical protein